MSGTHPFCISLDARTDESVSRIFGVRNYTIIDHVDRLPERPASLYVGSTR